MLVRSAVVVPVRGARGQKDPSAWHSQLAAAAPPKAAGTVAAVSQRQRRATSGDSTR